MTKSRKEKKVSNAERAEPKFDSVFDFLYHDYRRIGSFISQFDDMGLLEKIEKLESTTESAGDKAGVGGQQFRMGTDKTTDESATNSLKRSYDTLWANALAFLDYLEERILVQRDINLARIGQFILIKGRITLIDVTLLKSIWKIPEAQDNALKAALQNRPNEPPSVVERDIKVLLQLIVDLPHEPQCIFLCNGITKVWSLLKDDSLIATAGDLGLKYGMGVDGEWAMLGIVDALPGTAEESATTMAAVAIATAGHDLSEEVSRVAHVVRNLGRPIDAFGITPLLIFRSVNT